MFHTRGARRYIGGMLHITQDNFADESIVEIHYNQTHISTLTCSNDHLHELAIGHVFTEALNGNFFIPSSIKIQPGDVLKIDVISPVSLPSTTSSRYISPSCGGCNPRVELAAIPKRTKPTEVQRLPLEKILATINGLDEYQLGFQNTGGTHAAALSWPFDGTVVVEEDIGRHNAVDKVIGSALKEHRDMTNAVLMLSGRCGWDIVGKAITSGISTIVSIGAFSNTCLDLARAYGLLLIGFATKDEPVIIGAFEREN